MAAILVAPVLTGFVTLVASATAGLATALVFAAGWAAAAGERNGTARRLKFLVFGVALLAGAAPWLALEVFEVCDRVACV